MCKATKGSDVTITQLGNVFGMLVAGHGALPVVSHHSSELPFLVRCAETTAVTLVATLALLALYQDAQEEVLQQIKEVVGLDREPVRNTSLQSCSSLTQRITGY